VQSPFFKGGGGLPGLSRVDQVTEKTSSEEKGRAIEFLTFCLDGESYAVETISVQEITKMIETTFVPGTPSYVKGIVPIRGTVMPVFDLHERLGLSPFLKEKNSRFVICQSEEGPFAIMVDKVLDVVKLNEDQMGDSPRGAVLNESGCVRGVVKHKEHLLILVDIEKIATLN